MTKRSTTAASVSTHTALRVSALPGFISVGLDGPRARRGRAVQSADLYLPWEDPSSVSALSTLVFTLGQL